VERGDGGHDQARWKLVLVAWRWAVYWSY
jgi:hypothetical protein